MLHFFFLLPVKSKFICERLLISLGVLLDFLLRHHPCIRPIFFSSAILSNELSKTIIFQNYFLTLRFKLLCKRRHQRQVFLITFCGIQFISCVKKSKRLVTSDELKSCLFDALSCFIVARRSLELKAQKMLPFSWSHEEYVCGGTKYWSLHFYQYFYMTWMMSKDINFLSVVSLRGEVVFSHGWHEWTRNGDICRLNHSPYRKETFIEVVLFSWLT